nr:tetratricopeptide repeat protein [Candidatus Sigynarchaeota archaeon]
MSSAELELEEGLFLYERGLELVEREDWHEALSRFEMALHIFERVGTELEVSLCLKALGKIYGFLGRWLRAAECFEKDLEIQKRLGNEQELLEDIDHLVTYYTRSCDFEKAASQLERVHNVFQRSGNQEGVIRVQTYLGQTFENMGNLEKALSHYRMAFEVGEKLDSPSTIKLDTKIRELTELKTGGRERAPLKAAEITLEDSTLLEEPPGFRVRRVGGVQVEPQASD